MDFLPSLPTLLAFTAATLLLAATPGPDMTLSISRALSQGKAAAFFVVVGTSLGCVVHTLLVAFGISALITASPTAFMILKTGGAAYLFWLAVQAIRYGSTLTVKKVDDTGASALANISTGLWVNLLNPKVIIFFMTFLPQFVTAHDPAVTQKLLFLGFFFIRGGDAGQCAGHPDGRWPVRLAAAPQKRHARHRLYVCRCVLDLCGKNPVHADALNRVSRSEAHRHPASGREFCGTWR